MLRAEETLPSNKDCLIHQLLMKGLVLIESNQVSVNTEQYAKRSYLLDAFRNHLDKMSEDYIADQFFFLSINSSNYVMDVDRVKQSLRGIIDSSLVDNNPDLAPSPSDCENEDADKDINTFKQSEEKRLSELTEVISEKIKAGIKAHQESKEMIERNYYYHQPNPMKNEIFEEIRCTARLLAELYEAILPNGREKSLAHTNLEQSIMWANAGVARSDIGSWNGFEKADNLRAWFTDVNGKPIGRNWDEELTTDIEQVIASEEEAKVNDKEGWERIFDGEKLEQEVEAKIEKSTNLTECVAVVMKALNTNSSYYRSWKDNIAMAIVDQSNELQLGDVDFHKFANESAERILNRLLDYNL